MSNSTPTQLRFAPSAGFPVRADFAGGGLSSDLGPMLLRGIDRQMGLTARLTAAIANRRHPGYVQHPVSEMRFGSRQNFMHDLPCQLYAPDPALCGLCAAPAIAGACTGIHRSGHSATSKVIIPTIKAAQLSSNTAPAV